MKAEIFRNLMTQPPQDQPKILHVCTRDSLRPLRDEILRKSGFRVDSTLSATEALSMFAAHPYDLVLIDIESEQGVVEAEPLCGKVRELVHGQTIAFVCNWRVAIMTDCPDEILRTEFDPRRFVSGVKKMVE